MLNFDNIIIILYLIINLLLGLYFGRNIKSIRDYAIGNRNFSNLTLFSTIIATAISGSGMIFNISEIHKNSTVVIYLILGSIIGVLVKSELMTAYFNRYHKLSIMSGGEMMKLDYGKPGQILTGICSFLVCSGFVAMQLRVVGEIFSYCLNIDANLAIFTSSIIVIIYSSFGGIKSVAFTDVLQLIILVISLLVIAYICFNNFNSSTEFLYNILSTKLNINNISQEVKNHYISLFLFFTVPIFTTPVHYQRLLMAKNTCQAKITYRYAALAMFSYIAIISFIGFSILILEPKIESNQAFINIIDHYIPSGLKAIALIGVYAMIMSTADSYINCSGVALVNDVLKPLGILRPSKDELLYARIIIFIVNIILITVITLFSVVNNDGVISILLKMNLFWAPVVAPALFMNLFGFKTSINNLFLATFFGISATFIWDICDLSTIYIINKLIAGTIVNLVSLLILNLLFNYKKNSN